MLKIGEVSKKSNIGIETLRFYEREGLITLPERSASGYRQYPESAIKEIQFIQQAKTLGFSLKEIGELIKLKNTRGASCKNIKATAIAKIADIQEKIDALERMKMALHPLVRQCNSTDPISDCPILNALDEDMMNN